MQPSYMQASVIANTNTDEGAIPKTSHCFYTVSRTVEIQFIFFNYDSFLLSVMQPKHLLCYDKTL